MKAKTTTRNNKSLSVVNANFLNTTHRIFVALMKNGFTPSRYWHLKHLNFSYFVYLLLINFIFLDDCKVSLEDPKLS